MCFAGNFYTTQNFVKRKYIYIDGREGGGVDSSNKWGVINAGLEYTN